MIDQPEPLPPSSLLPPIYVAGPCSAESAEQLLSIARALSSLPLSFFRAGLWKPRTRPGSFEGVGREGIPWLQSVKQQTGLRVMTEVSTPKQLELVLEAGIDAIWLGARTVSDPFAVQEIADALSGCTIPVFIKNPISPDAQLWRGAIERVFMAGIQEVVAVFRGFSTIYAAGLHRNMPYWSVAFDLKRTLPSVPLLCDPSHITGKRKAVSAMAMDAMTMGFDGLMIETHCSPESAKSDAQQQILPSEMAQIIASVAQLKPSHSSPEEELQNYRRILAEIDHTILTALASRMQIAKKIGAYKMEHQIPILQTTQFSSVIEECTRIGTQLGLDPSFVERLFADIHECSVHVQSELRTAHHKK